MQPVFANLGYAEGSLPVSEDVSGRVFSIPMHPYLTMPVQKEIAAALAG